MTDDLVAAAPDTVLEGWVVGGLDTVSCSNCRRSIRTVVGSTVQVYAYRTAGDSWSLAELRCVGCQDDLQQLDAPTLGLEEILATARLAVQMDSAMQTSMLILADVDVVAISPPEEAVDDGDRVEH